VGICRRAAQRYTVPYRRYLQSRHTYSKITQARPRLRDVWLRAARAHAIIYT